MKIKLTVLVGILALMVPALAFSAQTPLSYPVQKIEDGDTLVLSIEGESVRVQLLGIDAPEDAQNPKFKSDLKKTGLEADQLMLLGKGATEYMNTLVKEGGSVSIQGELGAPDRYGRTPAIVLNTDGRDLSNEMIQQGYAVAMPVTEEDSDYIRRLGRLERFARKSGNGLWGRYPKLMRDWFDRTR